MNTYIKILLVSMVVIFTSCEDVIDVPLQTAPIRLVIEASLDWEKGTTGNEQTIRLSTSTAFFETDGTTAVTGATVSVTDDTAGTLFTFEDQNNGDYHTTEFVPIVGHSYILEILYAGETYAAQETLYAVPEITEIFQDIEDGFDDETLELHIVFTDPPEEGNNYLVKLERQGELLPEFEIGDDQFVNGNELDWWLEVEEDEETDEIEAFQPGETITVKMYGISTPYRDYMTILINQIGGAGLFSATPVSVKGNCFNQTNSDNYAHGFFRITELNTVNYTFE